MKLYHLINTVGSSNSPELLKAQEITQKSMLVAKEFSNTDHLNLTLQSKTYFKEDKIDVQGFESVSGLEKLIADYYPNLSSRPLPLIRDVFDLKGYQDDAFLIYTNVDIAVMPYFYSFIYEELQKGYDALVINRRRISKKYLNSSNIYEMYADLGKSHPGFDCFVFKKELLEKFVLGEICVGVPFLGVTLLHNILTFSQNPLVVMDKHLTFHIGLEVMEHKKDDYYWHNRNQFFKYIEPKLKPLYKKENFPYTELPAFKRVLKWALNPSLFTHNYLELEKRSRLQKFRIWLQEIRWRLLQR